ncbi:MAG: phytoene/squalene synthase family protein [Alphaproteobacteria bacterium]|jgi:phytoene synthase|nr:phytoene/squalene synthase family protein [Alphaproteobacteria bacterium]
MFAGPADLAACREAIRTGSRSFHAASRLLPEAMREGACALYAFCRLSDDMVDLEGGDLTAVARLRTRLDRIYAGAPGAAPQELCLADAVRRYGLPRTLLEALLEGLAWDATGRVYETVEELEAYAARVAGAVGAMMAVLMGARDADRLARACDLGVAMQFTNIARDVGEDARLGRLYLPRAWLRDAGLDPDAWLAEPVFCDALADVVDRLLDRADTLYNRAEAGIAALDPAYRPAIFAARLLYGEIGEEVRRHNLNSVDGRAVVPAWRKAALVARAAALARADLGLDPRGAPLEATRYLVEAVTAAPSPFAAPPQVVMGARRASRSFGGDLIWTLELFAALERRARPGLALAE